MEVGRSSRASKPARTRAGRNGAGAAPAVVTRQSGMENAVERTLVLNGTFSIEEINVKNTARKKAAKTTVAKKKVAKKKVARKKPAKAAAPAKKRGATHDTGGKLHKVASGPISLSPQPGIKNIAILQKQLKAANAAASSVVIDAKDVTSIDTAALQLLVAFANSIRDQSRELEWREPSVAFRELVDLADLGGALGLVDSSVAKGDDGLCPVF